MRPDDGSGRAPIAALSMATRTRPTRHRRLELKVGRPATLSELSAEVEMPLQLHS